MNMRDYSTLHLDINQSKRNSDLFGLGLGNYYQN
jgi:hypothetical protein